MSEDQETLFTAEQTTESSGPVECFGMTFESDEARRAHFLEKLKEKLPELRIPVSILIHIPHALLRRGYG